MEKAPKSSIILGALAGGTLGVLMAKGEREMQERAHLIVGATIGATVGTLLFTVARDHRKE